MQHDLDLQRIYLSELIIVYLLKFIEKILFYFSKHSNWTTHIKPKTNWNMHNQNQLYFIIKLHIWSKTIMYNILTESILDDFCGSDKNMH